MTMQMLVEKALVVVFNVAMVHGCINSKISMLYDTQEEELKMSALTVWPT